MLELPPRRHLLATGIQAFLDLSVLLLAFVAAYLLRAVQATQLLGCRSLLVGISPEIAQTLVGLGVDFSRITTRATLQNGLEYALKFLNYDVKRK